MTANELTADDYAALPATVCELLPARQEGDRTMVLTLARINEVIERVSARERRSFRPAIAAYIGSDGMLWLEGSDTASYSRVRAAVARELGVKDVYEGNHDDAHETQGHGHYDRRTCVKIV